MAGRIRQSLQGRIARWVQWLPVRPMLPSDLAPLAAFLDFRTKEHDDMALSRDDILDFDSGDPIPVEAFGGTVLVKPLSGTERDRYEMQNLKQTRGGATKLDLTNARARLVQLSVVDEDGRRMFTKDDIKRLGQLPAAELDKVAEVAREASGLSDTDEDEVESFDEDEDELVGASSS